MAVAVAAAAAAMLKVRYERTNALSVVPFLPLSWATTSCPRRNECKRARARERERERERERADREGGNKSEAEGRKEGKFPEKTPFHFTACKFLSPSEETT